MQRARGNGGRSRRYPSAEELWQLFARPLSRLRKGDAEAFFQALVAQFLGFKGRAQQPDMVQLLSELQGMLRDLFTGPPFSAPGQSTKTSTAGEGLEKNGAAAAAAVRRTPGPKKGAINRYGKKRRERYLEFETLLKEGHSKSEASRLLKDLLGRGSDESRAVGFLRQWRAERSKTYEQGRKKRD